jgi:hypothetical protein
MRNAIERASSRALTTLTQAPRWLVGLGAAAALLGGLMAPSPWGPLLLGLVTLFIAWLLVLAWPVLDGRGKATRSAVLVLLIATTIARAVGVL